jgi:16S rRNA (cytosine967-C5)-methyltransferase
LRRAVVAVDIDEKRMRRVQENLERLGQAATLVVADATAPDTWWDGKLFDRILLDAPCSATGVIRRHPDIKLLRRAEDIAPMAALQKCLLRAIWPMLAQGGMLLYSTCSVLKEENETQIGNFLATHPDAKELPITDVDWGNPRPYGRQIMTGESAMDGFFYAHLLKH